jgi:hypothetical protein
LISDIFENLSKTEAESEVSNVDNLPTINVNLSHGKSYFQNIQKFYILMKIN